MADTPTYTPWVESRRNLAVGTGAYWTFTTGTFVKSIPTAGTIRLTCTVAGNLAFFDALRIYPLATVNERLPLTPGQVVHAAIDWLSNDPRAVRLRYAFYDAAGVLIGALTYALVGPANQPDVFSRYEAEMPPAPAGTASATVTFESYLAASPRPTPLGFDVGDYMEFRRPHLTIDNQLGEYFDGNTADGTFARYQWLSAADASPSTEEMRTLVVPEIPPTRHSAHTARAVFVDNKGHVTDVGEVECTFNLDEGLSPYGDATLTMPLTPDTLTATDPLTHRGLRLQLELRESTGDPLVVSEITADLGGSVAGITAAYGPDLSPAKITSTYFVPWNPAGTRPGSSIRANLLVTSRDVDYAASRMSFTAATDEAALEAYKLVSKTTETSDSLLVSEIVNFALRKIGAVLQATIHADSVQEADAAVWDPGVSGWDYVSNVAEASGLVVRCDERRRWTLERRDQPPPRWGTWLPDVVSKRAFTAATERVELNSNLWAEAVVVRYSWTDLDTGNSHRKIDTASSISRPITVVTIDRDTRYPGPGSAAYWLKRLKGRGRIFELEEVGDYTLRPGIGITVWVPATASHTGAIEAVTWAVPSDRGTIRTRGTSDAIGNVIDNFPAGRKIDDIVGKIDDITVLTGV